MVKRSDKTDWRGLHMADLEKNILVVIPVNEDHKKFLEEKAASGDKNCCIRYVNGGKSQRRTWNRQMLSSETWIHP